MFSFSFCSTVVFTLSKPESTVLVVGWFFSPLPPPVKKGADQGCAGPSLQYRLGICESILHGQKEGMRSPGGNRAATSKQRPGAKAARAGMLLQTGAVQGAPSAEPAGLLLWEMPRKRAGCPRGDIQGSHARQQSPAGSGFLMTLLSPLPVLLPLFLALPHRGSQDTNPRLLWFAEL